MTIHYLKTAPEYFEKCWLQEKKFEVRKNDRNFKLGDYVCLKEYDSQKNLFTGRRLMTVITYILQKFIALDPSYVAFSFRITQHIEGLPYENTINE